MKYLKHKLLHLINLIYWLLCKPFGIIAINSCTIQICNRIQKNNLGDDLNFFLMKELSGVRIMNYNCMGGHMLNIRHYTCIGSIFDWCVDSASMVWGTGDLYGGGRKLENPKEIRAVRGPLTREVLLSQGIDCPEVYGDPALLLPLAYMPEKTRKKYRIGIIPHIDDYAKSNIQSLAGSAWEGVHIIRMKGYSSWKGVVDEICSCECIASSSLHGMIISDAYGIPNVWIKVSDKITGGGGTFKYQDYFASVGRNVKCLDFIDKEIGIAEILEKAKEYTEIEIGLSKLIGCCPFLGDEQKRKLIGRIPSCYNQTVL